MAKRKRQVSAIITEIVKPEKVRAPFKFEFEFKGVKINVSRDVDYNRELVIRLVGPKLRKNKVDLSEFIEALNKSLGKK